LRGNRELEVDRGVKDVWTGNTCQQRQPGETYMVLVEWDDTRHKHRGVEGQPALPQA
jgi:hypothetical protein